VLTLADGDLVVEYLERYYQTSFDALRALLAAAPTVDPLPLVVRYLQREKRVPAGFGTATLRRRLMIYRTHQRAAWSYRPQPYAGQVLLLRATKGATTSLGESLGWDALLSAESRVATIAGGHEDMVHAPSVDEVALILHETFRGACKEKRERQPPLVSQTSQWPEDPR
jgi:hypothetical protein